MSRCDEILDLLYAEPADGELSAEIRAHVASCPVCRACHEDLQAMRGGMQAIEPPALPDGFELSLRRRLNAAAAERTAAEAPLAATAGDMTSARRRWVPALIALAATLLLVAGGALLWKRAAPPAPASESFHRLTLSVRATTGHRDAAFSLELPSTVRLAPGTEGLGEPGAPLRWNSDLRPGSNTISLPLVVSAATSTPTVVTARVTVDGRTVTKRVPLSMSLHAGRTTVGAIRVALVLPALAIDGRRAVQ